ncbi:hypothetical protein G5714_010683 [Onychostoma macrolepis]|uniref:Uncharacterized protein n=1 Tax=Onychostoma macrolepis TaxID=369639 RepID=A0A7J6CLH0_9TELE|nr:hypothetical protein G5714_010683 [Onychostoma macrolepis]
MRATTKADQEQDITTFRRITSKKFSEIFFKGDGGVPVPRIQDVEDKDMWMDADEENTLGLNPVSQCSRSRSVSRLSAACYARVRRMRASVLDSRAPCEKCVSRSLALGRGGKQSGQFARERRDGGEDQGKEEWERKTGDRVKVERL